MLPPGVTAPPGAGGFNFYGALPTSTSESIHRGLGPGAAVGFAPPQPQAQHLFQQVGQGGNHGTSQMLKTHATSASSAGVGLPPPNFSTGASRASPPVEADFSNWMKRVILALGVPELEKQMQLTAMIEEVDAETIFGALPTAFSILEGSADTHGGLCLYFLENVLYAHPNALALFFQADMVYTLFGAGGETDDLRAGVLLWRLLKYKYESSKKTYGCLAETKKLLKLLERRYCLEVVVGGDAGREGGRLGVGGAGATASRTSSSLLATVEAPSRLGQNLRKIPPCCLRYTLVKIWTDIPPTRDIIAPPPPLSSSRRDAEGGASGSSAPVGGVGSAGHGIGIFSNQGSRRGSSTSGAYSSAWAAAGTGGNSTGFDVAPSTSSSGAPGAMPSSSTRASSSLLLLDACMHWLASPDEPTACKVPLLELLRAVVKSQSAIVMTSQMLTRFFAILATQHDALSDDIQFLLALLDWAEVSTILPALLESFADDKLVAMWSHLCFMRPEGLPELLHLNPSWSFFFEQEPLPRFQKILLQQFYVRNRRLGDTSLAILLSIVANAAESIGAGTGTTTSPSARPGATSDVERKATAEHLVTALRLCRQLDVAASFAGFFQKIRQKVVETMLGDADVGVGAGEEVAQPGGGGGAAAALSDESFEQNADVLDLLDSLLAGIGTRTGEPFLSDGRQDDPTAIGAGGAPATNSATTTLADFKSVCGHFLSRMTKDQDKAVMVEILEQLHKSTTATAGGGDGAPAAFAGFDASRGQRGSNPSSPSALFRRAAVVSSSSGGVQTGTGPASSSTVTSEARRLLAERQRRKKILRASSTRGLPAVSGTASSLNPDPLLYDAGNMGSENYRPKPQPSLIDECFQLVPHPPRSTFLMQKKIEQDRFFELFGAGEAGALGGAGGRGMRSAGNGGATAAEGSRTKGPGAGAEDGNGSAHHHSELNDPTSTELNRLFRENVALHQQITWKQMELASANLQKWSEIDQAKAARALLEEKSPPMNAAATAHQDAQPPPQYRGPIASGGMPGAIVGQVGDSVSVGFSNPRTGIRNTNNTCFVNTTLQALFHTDAFVTGLFKFRLRPPGSEADAASFAIGSELLKNLQYLFGMLLVTRRPHVEIESLLRTLPVAEYPVGEQQDVGEFVRFVFDKLGGFRQGLIRQNFAGELNEVTQCPACGHQKRRPETFTEVILPVPESAGRSLQELLEEKLAQQLMQDPITCPKCNHKGVHFATWSEIRSPPRQLVIALIRFDFRLAAGGLVKLKTPIAISESLQLGPYTYEFYFSIQHCGATADSGHYTGFGKRSDVACATRQYWKFDDSSVKPSSWQELERMAGMLPNVAGSAAAAVSDDTPYLLFYRCVSAPVEGEPLLPKSYVDMLQQEDARLAGLMS